MKKCEVCKHAIMMTSLSGHHIACKINANQPVIDENQDCIFYNNNQSGLEAYEKKHEFFAEEEFRVA
jgi:hypothetical protein